MWKNWVTRKRMSIYRKLKKYEHINEYTEKRDRGADIEYIQDTDEGT